MTIIIAAITTDPKGKEAIVMCEDDESYFSPVDDRSIFCKVTAERKIYPIDISGPSNAIIGTSGGGTSSTHILNALEANELKSFSEVKQTIREAAKDIESKLLASVLREFGVSTDEGQPTQASQFIQILMQESPEIYKEIQKRIEDVHSQMQFEITVVGFEPNNIGEQKAAIYSICDEPQNLLSIEVPSQVGWICAGVASAASAFSLNASLQGEEPRKTSIHQMLYYVYRAKRVAELTKGIGRGTEIFILLQGRKPRKLDEIDLKILEEHYMRELSIGSSRELKNIYIGDD